MKRKKLMVMAFTIICCTVVGGVSELKTAAASSTGSVGNFSAVENQVAWRSEDITYLSGELDALHSEIDDSVFDSDTVEGIVLASAGQRWTLLTSRGAVNYNNGKVVANAANLFTLADQTDALANAYTAAVCRALNDIGTYFGADGNVNHESQTSESIVLGREQLIGGIFQSQSVDHLAAAPVIADNITAGAAAWVNGKCIIGNGADNKKAYQRGIDDGKAGNREDVDIQYTYHAHTGNSGKSPIPDGDVYYSTSSPGGCYKAAGHIHNRTGMCSTGLVSSVCAGIISSRLEEERYPADGTPNIYNVQYCPSCGWTGGPNGYEKADGYPCGETIYTTQFTCGSPTNTWEIGCGKKAGQIESAEVIIHTRKETHE